MTKLYVNECGEYRAAADDVVIRCAQGAVAKRFRMGSPVMTSPERTREYLTLRLAHLDYEIFGCLYLDLCGAIIYVQCSRRRGCAAMFFERLVNITDRV